MDAQPAPAVAPIIPRACADLRRKLRGAMEAEAKPLLVMYGFRFSLGNGALFSYQGLPLCVRVEDVDKWRAMTVRPQKRRR